MWHIGADVVGIGFEVDVLDGGGHPVVTELMTRATELRFVWVSGCLFEVQPSGAGAAEQQTSSDTTISEVAWGHLPVANGYVPAVAANGQPTSVAVRDITSRAVIRCRDRDYEMRGDAVLEVDIDGREEYVSLVCERTGR